MIQQCILVVHSPLFTPSRLKAPLAVAEFASQSGIKFEMTSNIWDVRITGLGRSLSFDSFGRPETGQIEGLIFHIEEKIAAQAFHFSIPAHWLAYPRRAEIDLNPHSIVDVFKYLDLDPGDFIS